MIAFNYHKICKETDSEVYSISPESLARHLCMVRDNNLRVVGVDDVLSAHVDDGLVMFHFDDGTQDHAQNVFPLLETADAPGVFFISTAKIGTPGYLTISQVQDLSAAGHDIECHGHSHKRMDRMAQSDLDSQLETGMDLIRSWTGRAPRILSPPGGFYNPNIIRTARRHGFECIRSMRWNTNSIPLSGSIDCFVINHATTDTHLEQLMRGRGIFILRTAFLMKQMLRSVLPYSFYLKVRRALCLRRNVRR